MKDTRWLSSFFQLLGGYCNLRVKVALGFATPVSLCRVLGLLRRCGLLQKLLSPLCFSANSYWAGLGGSCQKSSSSCKCAGVSAKSVANRLRSKLAKIDL